MVVELKNYHLYTYFKTLKQRADRVPADKKAGISNWLDVLEAAPRSSAAPQTQAASTGHAGKEGKSRGR